MHFQKKIGVTPTTIDSIVNGRLQEDGTRKRTKPGYDVLMSIIQEFDVNPDYLFGTSDQMKSQKSNTYDGIPKVITVNEEGNENILFVPVKAKAGYLNGYGDESFVESLATFQMPQLRNGTYRCFEVEGNSMTPTFYEGDLVFGKYIEDFSELKDSKIYIVVSKDDGIVLKRVLNRIGENGTLILKSDNSNGDYPSYSIDQHQVDEIWEVVLFASRQISEPIDFESRLNQLESQFIELKESMRK